jgi:hypothetical protein
MIDWYSGLIGYSGEKLRLNSVCELTPEGEILWTIEKRMAVKGSYDATIQLGRSSPNLAMIRASQAYNLQCSPVCLSISGNPSKWLQGHNVFGPSVSSLAPVMTAVIRSLPENIRPADSLSTLWPAVNRTRVDVTLHSDLNSHAMVHDWLQSAGRNTRSKHGRAMMSGDTVYWGQHSRRWSLKAYCKFCELKVHHPPDLVLTNKLREFCETHVRFELTLRSPELKSRGTLDEHLVWDYLSKTGVIKLKNDGDAIKGLNLPMVVKATLIVWMAGGNVRQSLSRRTFYRQRRLILDDTGLDISLPYDRETMAHAVIDLPWLRGHEVKNGSIPASLLMQGLLFEPETSPRWEAH